MTCLLLLLHELLLFSASVVPYACYIGSYKSTVMVILMKKNVPFMMCDKSRTQITVDHGSVQVSNPTSSYVTCIVFSFIIFIRIKPFNLTFIYSVPASVLQISRESNHHKKSNNYLLFRNNFLSRNNFLYC